MRVIVSLSAFALLAACETAYPDISLDAATARPARVVSFDDKAPPEIIETAKPYPLPGQLKPVEEAPENPNLKPHQRIDTANERAKIEPDLDRFLNAVQVYPFMDGALYRLYAAPEQVTDIAIRTGRAFELRIGR